eukprot:TRINITY_DN9525_c0_g1_i2.p1 TRINITY_DN9525_c0_g1~~TRINITY_DN9525_c0_g1_i2.p1  ORF type:complete len:1033 (-),score=202.81 TRINITY_DN9525_c0_g1_i2:265-3363(-)
MAGSSSLNDAYVKIVERLGVVGPEGLVNAAEAFTFNFKGRNTCGGVLHVAALHTEGTELVKALLDANAVPDETCAAVAFGKLAELQPIHLACGAGNVDTVVELLWARADVEASTKNNGKPHYGPMHEAAYFGNHNTIRCLLEMGGSINALNSLRQTPLHVAAAGGNWRAASVLVEAKADLAATDEKGNTPLTIAVKKSFPLRKIGMLARPCVADLKTAAIEDPPAALELLRDRKAWKAALTGNISRQPSASDLVVLLRAAPAAAAELLDVLTVEPRAVDQFHHPLPKYGVRPHFDWRPCEYRPATSWVYFPDKRGQDCYPQWHDTLAPPIRQDPRNLQGAVVHQVASLAMSMYEGMSMPLPPGATRLQVTVLLIPNVVCVEVFRALAEVNMRTVFGAAAVQAIVDYAWVGVAMRAHWVQFILKLCELFVLVWLARWAPRGIPDGEDSEARFTLRCAWAVLATMSLREMFRNGFLLVAHNFRYRRVFALSYFTGRNVRELAIVGFVGSFTWLNGQAENFNPRREILAAVSFLRWIQLLLMLRSFRFLNVGFKIVPLVGSSLQVGGIFLILTVLFCAFVHMFLALDTGPVSSDAVSTTVLGAFRLLLLGDGDGIDFVLQLGAEQGTWFVQAVLYMSVLVFCIGVLNLFIAVHGEAYAKACEEVVETFYLQRTKVCLEAMVQPSWRLALPLGPSKSFILVFLPTVGMFVGLLFVPSAPAGLPPGVMFAGLLLGDMMLRKRPWVEEQTFAERSMRHSLSFGLPFARLRASVTPRTLEAFAPSSSALPQATSVPVADKGITERESTIAAVEAYYAARKTRELGNRRLESQMSASDSTLTAAALRPVSGDAMTGTMSQAAGDSPRQDGAVEEGPCYVWWTTWDSYEAQQEEAQANLAHSDAVADLERSVAERFDRVMSRLESIDTRLELLQGTGLDESGQGQGQGSFRQSSSRKASLGSSALLRATTGGDSAAGGGGGGGGGLVVDRQGTSPKVRTSSMSVSRKRRPSAVGKALMDSSFRQEQSQPASAGVFDMEILS